MNSIRSRLLLMMLSGLMVVLLIGGLVLDTVVKQRLTVQFNDALQDQAHTLASALVLDQGELEFEAAGSTNLPAYYRITLEDGSTFAGAGVFEYERDPGLPKGVHEVVWAEVELPEDIDGRSVSIAVIPHEEEPSIDLSSSSTPPLVVATVVAPLSNLRASIAMIEASIVVTGLLVLAAAGGVVWWGVRRGLSPLDQLVEELYRIKSDQLVPLERPVSLMSELSPVYDALDHLLTRIRSTFERERRFTDAAAHELRTPLAELRTISDVARRWPEADRLVGTVKKTGIIATRIQELIEALLMLSRNPQDIEALSHEPVSVARFAQEELDRQRGLIDEKSIDLQMTIDHTAGWALPEPVATLILRNLISNAVEYTPSNGKIELQTSGYALRLINGPVDLSRSQLNLLFEPFWRAETSRSDTTHHGLGLALVQHACESCGLSCKAALNNQFLTFMISAESNDSK